MSRRPRSRWPRTGRKQARATQRQTGVPSGAPVSFAGALTRKPGYEQRYGRSRDDVGRGFCFTRLRLEEEIAYWKTAGVTVAG
jgi:hypothetical protein